MAKKREEKTVLIIEDEANAQNFASRVLKLEGYHVLQARDGETGVEIALKNPVALVLLDLRLPGRDGWSVLTQIKSEPQLSAVPVVVLTARGHTLETSDTDIPNVRKVLSKPFSPRGIAELCATLLKDTPRSNAQNRGAA